MFLTLGEAAKQSGLAKATLSRAIAKGKLSAIRSTETNSFKIDPAELHRFSEALQVVRAKAETEAKERETTHLKPSNGKEILFETSYETRLKEIRERGELELRARLSEERLNDLKALLDDTRAERDQWRETAQRALLTHQQPQPATQPERRGLFGWLKRA